MFHTRYFRFTEVCPCLPYTHNKKHTKLSMPLSGKMTWKLNSQCSIGSPVSWAKRKSLCRYRPRISARFCLFTYPGNCPERGEAGVETQKFLSRRGVPQISGGTGNSVTDVTQSPLRILRSPSNVGPVEDLLTPSTATNLSKEKTK